MAITETVRNLDNPSVTKTIVLDLQKIIPLDTEGDEIYVTSATTTATSKITSSAIIPIFLREFKVGFSKSSGFRTAPFTVDASANKLQISVDGSTYHEITLTSGIGLSGDDIADDLQTQISALGGDGGAAEGDLGFLNILVEFSDNKFKILSGTISNTYTGVNKSAVHILPAASGGDASSLLGFDIPIESESLSSKRAAEAELTTTYTGGGLLQLTSVSDMEDADAFTITDGSNREYFIAADVDSINNEITISGDLVNTYSGGSIIQKIFERDPDSELASEYQDIDSLVRFQIRSIANQINFA